MMQATFRAAVLLGVAAAALAPVAPAAAVRPPRDVVCTGNIENFGEVTGSVKHDVIVPVNQVCVIHKATVGHDVILEAGSYVGISSSTIYHNVVGKEVSTLETANFEPDPGPVVIGHDLELSGIQQHEEFANGYTICDTTIMHDLVITGTATPFGTVIGDTGTGPEEFCTAPPSVPNPQDSIGHDVVITNNVFGRLDVGNNTIKHDMTIEKNTATTAFGDLGTIDISDNTVGHTAVCAINVPTPAPDGAEDGSNHAEHGSTCP